jgi:hypothetical protein
MWYLDSVSWAIPILEGFSSKKVHKYTYCAILAAVVREALSAK